MLIIYGVSASRRRMDTQTFTRIYAEIAVPVILKQREQGSSHSEINARVTLSREFVDFFEHHLPILITSLCSMIGAIVMLLEFWIGLAMSVLFESALWLLTVKGYGSSGHLYAITTYL
nr:ABC transporter six-transmembrane domain-containing protein [Kingella kingae]